MPHNLYLHSPFLRAEKINHENKSEISSAVKFATWDSNIHLTIAFVVNSLLLIMGVAVFKSGAIIDPSFFGLYDTLSSPSLLSNSILSDIAKTGALSTLFVVALLASGQNSTIAGTLTGQIVMEGFIHIKMPMWSRRLITRLIAVIPTVACVVMTRGSSVTEQHESINNLMNNSQVFLAFALPFSTTPSLMITNNKNEMGDFKNTMIVIIMGWAYVISLTYLNLISLSSQIKTFFPKNLEYIANPLSYLLITLIIMLLIWTTYDLNKGNKKLFSNIL